ncbi:hypothetical protein [Mycetohabitans endofungorum]|uniref:hypothetical protein n=1 Tax=Mycetohabitans endofungorum TaxID=417203 RepID=UPI001304C128|nr:hypothetical protein [Mycetohabitans endofungorum]
MPRAGDLPTAANGRERYLECAISSAIGTDAVWLGAIERGSMQVHAREFERLGYDT